MHGCARWNDLSSIVRYWHRGRSDVVPLQHLFRYRLAWYDLVGLEMMRDVIGELTYARRLYPAEITPLSIRAPANAISTTGNWIFNFMVVM